MAMDHDANAPRCAAWASIAALLLSAASAQTRVTLGPSKDNTLYESPTGGLSNGAGSHFFCGLTLNSERRRGLVAFDIASSIPRCSTIVSVQLVLHMVRTRSANQPVTLHRVLAAWGEGTSIAPGEQGGGAPATPGDATWIHTTFNTAFWSAAGGDFDATPSATTSVAGVGTYTWSDPGLTADVQRWVDDRSSNFGWLLRTVETGFQTAKAFATREDPDPTARPALIVAYLPPSASVTSLGAGCARPGDTPLSLGASGDPTVPNPSFALVLSGGPTGSIVAYHYARRAASTPIPLGNGCSMFLDPWSLIASIDGGVGRVLREPIPDQTALLGAKTFVQAVMVDTASGLPITSNALLLKLGL